MQMLSILLKIKDSIGIYNSGDSYFYDCTIECTVEGSGEYYFICGALGHNIHFINTSYSGCSTNSDEICWKDGKPHNWCYCHCQLTYYL